MYYRTLLCAIALYCSACSAPPAISVSCDRAPLSGDTNINCGDNDNNTSDVSTPAPAPTEPPVMLEAGCYQDYDVCPPTFEMSWLVEHCTIPYRCPVKGKDAGPDDTVCLRFIEVSCWDANSN